MLKSNSKLRLAQQQSRRKKSIHSLESVDLDLDGLEASVGKIILEEDDPTDLFLGFDHEGTDVPFMDARVASVDPGEGYSLSGQKALDLRTPPSITPAEKKKTFEIDPNTEEVKIKETEIKETEKEVERKQSFEKSNSYNSDNSNNSKKINYKNNGSNLTTKNSIPVDIVSDDMILMSMHHSHEYIPSVVPREITKVVPTSASGNYPPTTVHKRGHTIQPAVKSPTRKNTNGHGWGGHKRAPRQTSKYLRPEEKSAMADKYVSDSFLRMFM